MSSKLAWSGLVLAGTLACGGTDDDTSRRDPGSGAGGAPGSGGGSSGGGSLGGGPIFAAGGASGAPAACQPTGGPCQKGGDCCDPEASVCNAGNTQVIAHQGCQRACQQNADCPSGCCFLYENNPLGFCADAKWCACGTTSNRCGTQEPRCCGDHACIGGDPQATFFECRPKCVQNSDCATSCCVDTAVGKLCLDAVYCP